MKQPPDDGDGRPRRTPRAAGDAAVGWNAATLQEGVAHEQGRTYPARVYGRTTSADVYPEQPAPDADWPAVSGLPPRPPQRVRSALIVAVILALLAAAVVTTYRVMGASGSRGTDTPEQAVEGFLGGIYHLHDPRSAGRYVCGSARVDAELDQIVFRVEQAEQSYTGAQTTWTYPPIRTEGRRAAAEVSLTLTTANEQVARRSVTLLLVDDRGWWVCDVRAA